MDSPATQNKCKAQPNQEESSFFGTKTATDPQRLDKYIR